MLIKFFAAFGVACFVGLLIYGAVFGPRIYRALRDEYGGAFPFDYPVWAYAIRRFVRRFWKNHRHDIARSLFLAFGLLLIWLCLVITHPYQP